MSLTHEEKNAVILRVLLAEMAENNIEDTIPNRIDALQGLSDAWKEDPDKSFEKLKWQFAVTFLIIDQHREMIKKL